MKVLILGAKGLLGRHLHAEFQHAGHEVVALGRDQLDVARPEALRTWVDRDWDAVVNAAAVCHFEACESAPEDTDRVNLHAPLALAELCAARGAIFCQFSSDYIFDGTQETPYLETDQPRPLSVYGRQKAALEHLVPRLCPQALVLRVAWLYGLGGRTFLSLLPGLLQEQETLTVAAGKTGRCLYVRDGARLTRLLVERREQGVFNMVNDGDTAWEVFAARCLDRMQTLGFAPRCREIRPVPFQTLSESWAKRPRHSALDLTKLSEALGAPPRSWEQALDAYLAEWRAVRN